MVVNLVVLTEMEFRFSLFISQLLAKAIPVRGAKIQRLAIRKSREAFLFMKHESRRSVLTAHPSSTAPRYRYRNV
ncbi:hypothetical protein E0I03_10310 [Dickeya dadantii]|nr:hypothetical protein [Dickeya dadantii]